MDSCCSYGGQATLAVLKTSRGGAGVAGGRAGTGEEAGRSWAQGAGRAVVGEPAGQGKSRRRRGAGVAGAGRGGVERRGADGGGWALAVAGRSRAQGADGPSMFTAMDG
ncbi:hypothetical protein E2562_034945 [Oryza meyeriana var. granulata]|uniref:Uncharacterized protein n=1 Tax=Oryza meyeriana var. granulata TaxID=110450 RepID=A0A6G1D976_9ORYZ|nr:hypothetical protein E2562_034945 [Oryza meyeriana var. granulata]